MDQNDYCIVCRDYYDPESVEKYRTFDRGTWACSKKCVDVLCSRKVETDNCAYCDTELIWVHHNIVNDDIRDYLDTLRKEGKSVFYDADYWAGDKIKIYCSEACMDAGTYDGWEVFTCLICKEKFASAAKRIALMPKVVCPMPTGECYKMMMKAYRYHKKQMRKKQECFDTLMFGLNSSGKEVPEPVSQLIRAYIS